MPVAVPMRRAFVVFIACAMALSLVATLAAPVRAATITVNTPDDELNTDIDCSLREAIEAANTDAIVDACLAGTGDADIITLPANTYLLSTDLGELLVTESVNIVGPDRATTVINGQDDDRVFNLQGGVVGFSNLTIRGGLAEDVEGGGINVQSAATLNLLNVVVTDNHTIDAGSGGGIFLDVGGSATITGSVISANTSEGNGGGITINDLADLTITGSVVSGNSADFGGGIFNDTGDLDVLNSTVSGNEATFEGGGIWTDGDLSLLNATIHDNDATSGGGIFVPAGGAPVITIDRSTISANTATASEGGGQGGGVYSHEDFSIVNSTVSGNSASFEGGGVWVFADLAVDFSTVTLNSSAEGAGIWVIGDLELFASIVANNLVDEDCTDADANLISLGSNIDSDNSCELDPALNDKPNVDPLLGPLFNNGGPTMTHALLAGSPAIDAVVASEALPCVGTDQRGELRPQDGDTNGTLLCDIGAFELVPPPPAASIDDVTVTEGNAGTTVNATFTVTLSRASATPVTIAFATANGSATAPADYQSQTGVLTFAPGDVSETISITVVGDALDEPNETFTVTLSVPVGATLADAQGTGTILDDDGPPTLSINDVSVTEGNSGFVNAVFTVRLLPAAGGTVTVAFATANGTATAPADYESASGTVTFAAGDTEETITVRVAGDTVDEPNETFVVNLSSPTGATISDSQGTGTILDDDGAALPDTATGGPSGSEAGLGLVLLAGSGAIIASRRRRTVRRG